MKRIFVCPLDWGLGHATRCIPLIKELMQNGAEVVIGADGGPLALLKQEFPQLEFIRFAGYNISYPANGKMAMAMAAQAPRILHRIREEQKELGRIIDEHHIDAVISDNRFGLWSKDVPCVFITHQAMVKSPVFEGLIHKFNKQYMNKYTRCWIPDFPEGDILSGDLAHRFPLPKRTEFIGPLSRFEPGRNPNPKTVYDILAIISGPEPQRTVFEEMMLEQLKNSGQKALVVLGKPGGRWNENPLPAARNKDDMVQTAGHLPTKELQEAILTSEIVISRPGYSTIMDLAVLGKKAVFVPTPGQTEQEYLAKYHKEKGSFYSMRQKTFDLEAALKQSVNYSGIKIYNDGLRLKDAVGRFLEIRI